MKRIFTAYRELVGILFAESPVMVIATFAASLLAGMLTSLSLWVNARIFNLGLEVAGGTLAFASYIPNLVLFAVLALLPAVIGQFFVYSCVSPRCQLILRTAYKGKILQKLKKLKYEHFENDASMEIIDKAYNRTENAARHLFPMYIFWSLSSLVASAGTLYLFASVRWWLLLTILIPFALETWLSIKYFTSIYNELEHYWNKERRYFTLAEMLRSRDYIKENRLFRSSDYLIGAYRDRDFIILDEPTSNLDPLAETGVFRQYIALVADKTVIFVTHRISVAALAGRIIVFAGGKIAEDGSHETLMRSGGEYARLYREQAKWYNR